jgi:putative ABC transport system permease protein
LRLIVGEALFLTVLGGLIGFGLAYLAVGGMAGFMKKYFPVFEVSGETIAIGFVLMIVLGIVAGMWPAVSAMRLKITEALRKA